MHTVAALRSHQSQGIFLRRRGRPFGGLKVHRVTAAVVVLVSRDLRAVKLDEAGLCVELVCLRIGTEFRKGHVLTGRFRHVVKIEALVPEGLEVGHRDVVDVAHAAGIVVDLFDPLHFSAAFGEFLLKPEFLRQLAVDPVVAAAFVLRLNRLVHRHHAVAGVGTDDRNIVVFQERARRKHDVGVTRRRCPHHVGDDDRIGLLPRAFQAERVGVMREGIAARPHDHAEVRVRFLLAVKVAHGARVFKRIRNRGDVQHLAALPGLHGTDRGDLARNAAHEGAVGKRRAARRVVVARTEPAAGETDLAQRRRQGDEHPVELFAVINTLDTPADHEHRAVGFEVMREGLDGFGLDAGNLRSPFRGFLDAVFVAHQIGAEFLPPRRVLIEERVIGFARHFEFVNHGGHDGGIGTGIDGHPFALHVFRGVVVNRVDAIGLRPLLFKGTHVARVVMQRRVPVDVVRHQRVAAPEDDAFAVIDHVVPRRAAGVAGTHHVGKNGVHGRGRIGIALRGEAAHEVQQSVLQGAGIVHAPRGFPAVAGTVNGRGAVRVIHPSEFFRDEFKRLIPGNSHELVFTALFLTLGTGLQIAFTHHRVADAGFAVRNFRKTLNVGARRVVVFKGFQFHDATAFHDRAHDTPAGGGDGFALI